MELAFECLPADGSWNERNGTMSSHPRQLSHRRRESLWPLAVVLGGGVVGSAGRAAIGELLPHRADGFPLSVLTVNLVGGFLLGYLVSRLERAATHRRWSVHFWGIGVLGSFTTFSAFSLDVVQLLEADRIGLAFAYLTASIVGGLAAALVGLRLGGDAG